MAQIVDQVVPDHTVPMPLTGLVQSFSSTLNLWSWRNLVLPIKKINNIGVEVSICRTGRCQYTLNIRPTEFKVDGESLYKIIYDKLDDSANVYKSYDRSMSDEVFIQHIVEDMLTNLKKIKIDKFNGNFVKERKSVYEKKQEVIFTEFCQEFKDDENMVLSLNECCVCFTVTKTTTNCGHAVCLECISKLQPEVIADDGFMHHHISCPMCRQRILALN